MSNIIQRLLGGNQAQMPGQASQPSGLSRLLQPEVALPMAAALMGQNGNMNNVSNAFGAAGPALQAQKADYEDRAEQNKTWDWLEQQGPEWGQYRGIMKAPDALKLFLGKKYAQTSGGAFGSLASQAEAAGLQPGTPEYQDFMLYGGGPPEAFRTLDMQAQAAGHKPGTPGYQQFVADRGNYQRQLGTNQANIETGGAAAQAGQLGTDAAKYAGTALENVGKVRGSIANIDEAIAAIDSGAETGLVYNMLPNVTEASASLQNAMDRMGLDVVGSVTFGALSEGEMRLAMSVAVPRNLQAPQLKEWLTKKRAAQLKAHDALIAAALYLSQPGNTINGWMQTQQGGGVPQPGGDDVDPLGIR